MAWCVASRVSRGDRVNEWHAVRADRLEERGWRVEIADAQKVKGLAPLTCKTHRIDALMLGELSRRDLVPAIWPPGPAVRGERERARWRLHLVRDRTAPKNRLHRTLVAFGVRARCLIRSAGADVNCSSG